MNFENVFIQIPSYTFWKDTNFVFRGCNQSFAMAAGLSSPKEIIGKNDYDLIWADSHADFYRHGDQEVLAGIRKINVRETQLQSDGRIVTILLNKVPLLNEHKQIIGVVGNYMEVCDEDLHGKYKSNLINIPLTKIQSDCLFYLAQGMTCKEIAKAMSLSWRTVQHYTDSLKQKLKCQSKSELIRKALTLEFIKARLSLL